MFPSTDEYYAHARNANYKKFEEKDRQTKTYIDLSVGFYAGCSYHPNAWEATFSSLRKHFPTEPIVLFEDGRPTGVDYSDMAARYSATYIRETESIYLYWPTPEQCWTYLTWILKAADICNTEWLVQLHPDNICNDRFSTPPPGPLCGVGAGSRSGCSNNQIFPRALNYLRNVRKDVELNGYGWCGGGCIHVPTFRKIMETFTYETLKSIHADVDHTVVYHEDVFLPFLFNLHGYPYRVWVEIEEPQRGELGYGVSAAFQHGNKDHYNLTPEQARNFGKTIIDQVNQEKLRG